jgi:hypothetical protein
MLICPATDLSRRRRLLAANAERERERRGLLHVGAQLGAA